jgi:hypothetical protein
MCVEYGENLQPLCATTNVLVTGGAENCRQEGRFAAGLKSGRRDED